MDRTVLVPVTTQLTEGETGVIDVAQNVIYGSLAVAIGMILASVADIITGFPFGGNLTPDIIFIVSSAVVVWMAIDCLRGLRRRK